MQSDATIIGSGPAGLVAVLHISKSGARNVLLLEREEELGGILKQCILYPPPNLGGLLKLGDTPRPPVASILHLFFNGHIFFPILY
jgi:heterodisulfide reductase subunit A-like polyferredoxin